MGLENNWDYYYDKKCLPFQAQVPYYRWAIDRLAFQSFEPGIKDFSQPKTYVLGGFHPGNSTLEDFKKLTNRLHAENSPKGEQNNDKHIILDQNMAPLKTRAAEQFPLRFRSKLEQLPLQRESVDFLFLDYTVIFMNSSQIEEFGKECETVLKPKGLVFIVLPNRNGYIRRLSQRINYGVNCYDHSLNKLNNHLLGLKPVTHAEDDDVKMAVFARNDGSNNFPTHFGEPYLVSEDTRPEYFFDYNVKQKIA